MDPVVVNATMEHTRLENERVRAIEGILQPGDKEEMHSHPAFVTYVIAGSKIRNHFADGKVVETDLETGDVLWRDPQTHWIENIGDHHPPFSGTGAQVTQLEKGRAFRAFIIAKARSSSPIRSTPVRRGSSRTSGSRRWRRPAPATRFRGSATTRSDASR